MTVTENYHSMLLEHADLLSNFHCNAFTFECPKHSRDGGGKGYPSLNALNVTLARGLEFTTMGGLVTKTACLSSTALWSEAKIRDHRSDPSYSKNRIISPILAPESCVQVAPRTRT